MTEKMFMTIRQVAMTGVLSECHLRVMQKQGRLPGVRRGNRFLVNYPMLVEMLNEESKKNVKGGLTQ